MQVFLRNFSSSLHRCDSRLMASGCWIELIYYFVCFALNCDLKSYRLADLISRKSQNPGQIVHEVHLLQSEIKLYL